MTGGARRGVTMALARIVPVHPGEEGVRIIPETGTASRPLTVVMAVMCFLACLALGSLFIINRSVAAWTNDIGSELTVQIKPVAGADTDQEVAKAVEILRASPGVLAVNALSKADNARLLEPWLGSGNVIDDLPVPRLIEVRIDRANPPNLAGIGARLESEVEGAVLDSHTRWQSQIRRSSGTLRLLGFAVLLLVSGTTVAIVVFATRAAMASNHDTIEVLHLIGAQDNFIATKCNGIFSRSGSRPASPAPLPALRASSFSRRFRPRRAAPAMWLRAKC